MSTETPDKEAILIVDDLPVNLKVLVDYLENTGFVDYVAKDGKSAIEQLRYSSPGVILLDVMMSGMDGFETCRRLKVI